MNEMLDEPKKNINTHHLLGEDEINNVGEIKIEDTKLRKLHEEIEEEIEDTIKSISRDLRYYLIRTEIKLQKEKINKLLQEIGYGEKNINKTRKTIKSLIDAEKLLKTKDKEELIVVVSNI